MVSPKDIRSDITLEIGASHLSPGTFIKAVRAFLGLVDEITTGLCDPERMIEWTVQVYSGSNLIGVTALPGIPDKSVLKLVGILSSGIEAFETSAIEPDHFSDQAVKYLRDLGSLTDGIEPNRTSVHIWGRKNVVEITRNSVKNYTRLYRDEIKDHGSIEGKLQTVSERGGFHVVIYEPVWDKAVRCYLSDDLLEIALANFGKRVQVFGQIKYRKDGSPISIQIEEISGFPDSDDIPDFRSVRGILRKAQ